MGSSIGRVSHAIDALTSSKSVGIMMVGLDGVGKTTILYKLKLGEVVTTVPTVGFNCEIIEYKNVVFSCWDVGGKDKIRALWRHYYYRADAIIFVIDSTDRDRICDDAGYEHSAKDEIYRMLAEDELRDAPLLVFATKQDVPQAMSPEEVIEKLALKKLRNRVWKCQGCVGTLGTGLYEGLDWLSKVAKTHKGERVPKCEIKQGLGAERAYKQSIQLIAPCIAFVYHNQTSTIADSVLALLPQIMSFVGSSAYKISPVETSTQLQAFCRTRCFNALTGRDDLAPELIAKAVPTSKLFAKSNLWPSSSLPASTTRSSSAVVDDDAILRHAMSHEATVDVSDEALLQAVLAGNVEMWTHAKLLRVIYVFLCRFARSEAVSKLHARVKLCQGDDYHCTLLYFWIQVVDYSRSMDEREKSKRDDEEVVRAKTSVGAGGDSDGRCGGYSNRSSSSTDSTNSLSNTSNDSNSSSGGSDGSKTTRDYDFIGFVTTHQELLNGDLYLQYYSTKVIASLAARSNFALPDLKSLPSILVMPASKTK